MNSLPTRVAKLETKKELKDPEPCIACLWSENDRSRLEAAEAEALRTGKRLISIEMVAARPRGGL